MEKNVPYYLKHQYNLYDRTPKTGIKNICTTPKNTLTIDNQGNCLLCICDGWLPISVGHIRDFDSFEEIWQTDLAKTIQKDVADKNYTWCSVDHCGIKNNNFLRSEYFISINIDESCNLQCPTCRTHFINKTNGKIYENKLKWSNHIVRLLEKFDHVSTIKMSGNGDPFASFIYRPILMNLAPNNKHNYQIATNGLLLKKLLIKTKIFNKITNYSISIDAGDRETYEKVRLRGNWEVLIENLNFLKLVINNTTYVNLNFCLHKENFNSLENFVKLVDHYKWKGTIQPIEDWNTIENFDQQNVCNKNHELFYDVCSKLKKISKNKNIFLSGVLQTVI